MVIASVLTASPGGERSEGRPESLFRVAEGRQVPVGKNKGRSIQNPNPTKDFGVLEIFDFQVQFCWRFPVPAWNLLYFQSV